VTASQRPELAPDQVWWVDLEPVRGREQGKDRPALVVSSSFHLALTGGALATVLPLTTVERPWPHRAPVGGRGWVITERIRTVSSARFRRYAPEIQLTPDELAAVRTMLRRMVAT
jgi:mRNA interferase MazF